MHGSLLQFWHFSVYGENACFSFGIFQFMEKMHMCLKGVTVVW